MKENLKSNDNRGREKATSSSEFQPYRGNHEVMKFVETAAQQNTLRLPDLK